MAGISIRKMAFFVIHLCFKLIFIDSNQVQAGVLFPKDSTNG